MRFFVVFQKDTKNFTRFFAFSLYTFLLLKLSSCTLFLNYCIRFCVILETKYKTTLSILFHYFTHTKRLFNKEAIFYDYGSSSGSSRSSSNNNIRIMCALIKQI